MAAQALTEPRTPQEPRDACAAPCYSQIIVATHVFKFGTVCQRNVSKNHLARCLNTLGTNYLFSKMYLAGHISAVLTYLVGGSVTDEHLHVGSVQVCTCGVSRL